jgi:hypothetical protein
MRSIMSAEAESQTRCSGGGDYLAQSSSLRFRVQHWIATSIQRYLVDDLDSTGSCSFDTLLL